MSCAYDDCEVIFMKRNKDSNTSCSISGLLRSRPDSTAILVGNKKAPNLKGSVCSYDWANGTVIKAEIVNIPDCVTNPVLWLDKRRLAQLVTCNGYCLMIFYTEKAESLSNMCIKVNNSLIAEQCDE